MSVGPWGQGPEHTGRVHPSETPGLLSPCTPMRTREESSLGMGGAGTPPASCREEGSTARATRSAVTGAAQARTLAAVWSCPLWVQQVLWAHTPSPCAWTGRRFPNGWESRAVFKCLQGYLLKLPPFTPIVVTAGFLASFMGPDTGSPCGAEELWVLSIARVCREEKILIQKHPLPSRSVEISTFTFGTCLERIPARSGGLGLTASVGNQRPERCTSKKHLVFLGGTDSVSCPKRASQ